MEANVVNTHTEHSTITRRVEITINGTRYHISESVDGKLVINKPDLGDSTLMVFPRYSNEIEIK